MANIVQTYFNIYFTEIIVGVLILSIVVVLISIFYVYLLIKMQLKTNLRIQKK